ncbi:hypothetical protein Vadar_006704 [Vaccinium darrowii]|uniref:Uncharacterized protein n=1 Tax=Vaccinium darrowii TaxID=229202 RepID=A0ACB7YVE5_9ERIC|nr:hypothetical protein Vadar_006704 [Vaccinium darrowii]
MVDMDPPQLPIVAVPPQPTLRRPLPMMAHPLSPPTAMPFTHPYFDFILNHKGKVVTLCDIDPERYCYFDLMSHVSEGVLADYPAGLGLSISMFCELRGSGYRVELDSDKALIDLFSMDGIPSTLNIYVDVDTPTPCQVINPNEVDGDDVVEVDGNQDRECVEDDPVYGFSDEDDDWLLCEDDEGGQSDDGGSLVDEINMEDDDDGLSDYQSGDEGENLSSGSDDEGLRAGAGFGTSYNAKEPYLDAEGEVVLEEKMIFTDVDAFRAKLRDYTVEKGFKIIRDKNEKCRVTAHCAFKGCPWRIHASPLPDGITYQIKTYTPEHTCSRVNQNEDATSTWIARKLLQDFKDNPQLGLDAMQEKLNTRYGIEASRIQLYRARRKCVDVLEGSHGGQYKLLPTYAVRPFIGIDGCHLKGPYGGVHISAVALDGNSGLFPLAVVVVESENNDSWGFFLNHIQTIIRSTGQNRAWTIMSDQQKGLDRVVERILPEASHRFCAKHLYNNFKAKFPGLLLRKKFWYAARAYNQRDLNEHMAAIKEINTEAHDHLAKLSVSSWARHAFDERVRSDHITNNGTESFNNWLGPFRGKPILTMLEGIRCKVMSRIQTRYKKGVAWKDGITANSKKICTKIQRFSRHCKAEYCGGTEYDVMDNGVRYLVDLGKIECVCRQWQISGIPCKHAMAAIVKDRKNVEDYVHSYFSKDMYLRAHGRMIHPILDPTMWTMVPGDPLEPPPLRRLSGRPRKNRKRAADEPEKTGKRS